MSTGEEHQHKYWKYQKILCEKGKIRFSKLYFNIKWLEKKIKWFPCNHHDIKKFEYKYGKNTE